MRKSGEERIREKARRRRREYERETEKEEELVFNSERLNLLV